MKKVISICLSLMVSAVLTVSSSAFAEEKVMDGKKMLQATKEKISDTPVVSKAGMLKDKATSVSELKKANLVKLPSGGVAYEMSTGYVCGSQNGVCICKGDENSEDCQAMKDNICNENEELDCETLIGMCKCNWGASGGISGSGAGSSALEVQTSH